jgi:hypothetical protein
VIALFLEGYFYLKSVEKNSEKEPHSTFFSFVFGPTMQNITSGNLYLNLTFDVVGGNLTVKAEVNADSYNPDAVLALQFDSDNNGTIDIRQQEIIYNNETIVLYDYFYGIDDLQFLLRANNRTLPSDSTFWGWYANGTIYLSEILPSGFWDRESTFHYCICTNGVYTFNFTYPISNPKNPHDAIQGKLVRAFFGVAPPQCGIPLEGMAVYVPPFNFME